jgi:hypothetical protein
VKLNQHTFNWGGTIHWENLGFLGISMDLKLFFMGYEAISVNIRGLKHQISRYKVNLRSQNRGKPTEATGDTF